MEALPDVATVTGPAMRPVKSAAPVTVSVAAVSEEFVIVPLPESDATVAETPARSSVAPVSTRSAVAAGSAGAASVSAQSVRPSHFSER